MEKFIVKWKKADVGFLLNSTSEAGQRQGDWQSNGSAHAKDFETAVLVLTKPMPDTGFPTIVVTLNSPGYEDRLTSFRVVSLKANKLVIHVDYDAN